MAGHGIQMLRDQGIAVEVGLLRDRALRLNERFIKYILTKQPFVTLKSASTLDGNLATKSGDSKWISNGGSAGDRTYAAASASGHHGRCEYSDC